MIGVALKGLLGRKLRAALTAFAIVLGVAMISGSFVLTDTLSKSFDGIYNETYESTDAVISSEEAIDTTDTTAQAPAFSADLLREVEALPGVRLTQGSVEDSARLVDENGKAIGNADEGVAIGVDPAADQSLNPLKLVTGEVAPGRRPDRNRQGDRRRSAIRGRTDRPGIRGRPGRADTGSAGSSASARSTRSAARRSPSSISRPPSACSTSAASST